MNLVIDASAFIALMLGEGEEGFRQVLHQMLRHHGAYAPGLWWYEVANTLMVGVRRGRHDADFAKFVLQRADEYLITSDKRNVSFFWTEIFDLAMQHELTVYNASYLHLAIERRAILATLDQALAKAARQSGVELLQP